MFQWTLYESSLRRAATVIESETDSIDHIDDEDGELPQHALHTVAPQRLISESVPESLPIDLHRVQILDKVNRERVVLIHGETGERWIEEPFIFFACIYVYAIVL